MDAKGRVLSEECIADEVPFELPEGWCWARLESIASVIIDGDHQAPPQKPLGVPFLVISNLSSGELDFSSTRFVSRNYYDALDVFRKPQRDDLLLTVTGSYGIVVKVDTDREFCFQRHIALIRLVRYLNFIISYLSSPSIRLHFNDAATGTAQKTIPLGCLRSTLVPIPPLTEQRCIVEKVDELMPLVEEYGRLEDAREALDAGLSDRLRKSILQQAIQGRLAPQDPSDEPARARLARVRAERRRLVKEGKARFPKGGESVIYTGSDGGHYEKRLDAKGRVIGDAPIEDEIPFDIPEGWAWARLGSVSQIRGGATPDKSNSAYWNGTVNWASMKDIHGDFLLSTIDRITEEGLASKTSIGVCQPGELIVSSRLVPGKSIISKIVTAINQDLKIVQSDAFLVDYLHYWFQSQLDVFKRLGSGTTVPGIKLERLESSLIPTPSLAEQARIVDVLHGALPPLTNQ